MPLNFRLNDHFAVASLALLHTARWTRSTGVGGFTAVDECAATLLRIRSAEAPPPHLPLTLTLPL